MEDIGTYDPDLDGRFFASKETRQVIIDRIHPRLKSALTDPSAISENGTIVYTEVDNIKMILKQVQGLDMYNLESKAAGKLQDVVYDILKELTSSSCSSNSAPCVDRNDKKTGHVFYRIDVRSGKKFQVVKSTGKHLNAVQVFYEWAKENTQSACEKRKLSFSQNQKSVFFTALSQVAHSEDTSLEMLQMSEYAAAKLTGKKYDVEEEKIFADLILMAINQNQQRIRAVAANYRRKTRSVQHQQSYPEPMDTSSPIDGNDDDMESSNAEFEMESSSAVSYVPTVEEICAVDEEYIRFTITAADFIQHNHLRLVFAKSDGHCILHAWSIATGTSIDDIKQNIIDEYLHHVDRYSQFGVNEQELSCYLENHQFELQSVDTVINILSNSTKITAIVMEEHENGSTHFKIIRPNAGRSSATIILCRKAAHYDAVVWNLIFLLD